MLVLVASLHMFYCACPGVNPRVKSGRFMKLLPDYEPMDYRDVYTHCMCISLKINGLQHVGLCEWGGSFASCMELKCPYLQHGVPSYEWQNPRCDWFGVLCFLFRLSDGNAACLSFTHKS